METKKAVKANLENKRAIFIQLGLCVALSLILVAFEWTSTTKHDALFASMPIDAVVEEYQPLPLEEKFIPPAPPVPSLEIKPIDDMGLEDDPIFIDVEGTEKRAVPYIPYEPEDAVDDIPVYSVPQMPSFNGGGLNEFWKYVNQHIQYPKLAADNGVYGTVTVQFVVNKIGDVVNIKIIRGVDPALDQEAIRVIGNSPKWIPGMQGIKAVSVIYTMPLKFVLQ